MTPVRLAAVGVGRWGGVLADAAGRGTGLTVVACTSRSPQNRALFAKTYGCRDLPSYEAVLADPEVEGVLITTPHSVHAEQVVAAAGAGKHVFVDKPFTLTVADGRRATEACRRARVVLAVGHQRRKQAASRALKRLLDEGALGRVAQVEGNFSGDIGFTFKPGLWRADRAETPAGAMTNIGIHHVDTYQYLLGPIARATAFSRRVALTGVDIDDATSILFEFASGSLGYLGTSWVHANRTAVITLHGTEAQAWSEEDGTRLFLGRRGQPERTAVPLTPLDPVVEELAEFARCVRDGTRPEVGGEEATANVAVLEAIVESVETGRAVAVGSKEGRR
ncbi:MAG TPA: Gfo/Idh/MocA family oxidoreductase [Methylomirabilota bacterium]|jgi:predicted dehydrogenase|nr:Gfo/Idh/MocA family oxidoreductase [Methylomirabilota bacterium]